MTGADIQDKRVIKGQMDYGIDIKMCNVEDYMFYHLH